MAGDAHGTVDGKCVVRLRPAGLGRLSVDHDAFDPTQAGVSKRCPSTRGHRRRHGQPQGRLLSTRPGRPPRSGHPAGRCLPHLVRPGVGRGRRVPGAVRVLLRRQVAAQCARATQPALSPRRELVRLVRRLLPALVVVLAASAVLTILIQPQTRWEAFADQSLASLGYYQNWELRLDGVELPEGRRGGQSAAAHLVDVGAGPVLPRVPAGGVRRQPRCCAARWASGCGSSSWFCSAR